MDILVSARGLKRLSIINVDLTNGPSRSSRQLVRTTEAFAASKSGFADLTRVVLGPKPKKLDLRCSGWTSWPKFEASRLL